MVIELKKDLTAKSLAAGFSKFVSLCSPGNLKRHMRVHYILPMKFTFNDLLLIGFLENIRQFWLQDNNFYSLLEGTKWLRAVSYCLEKAVEASDHLSADTSVILQGTT